MKTHFDPYTDHDDLPDKTMCGVRTADEGYDTTTQWNNVTCLRCINQKEKLMLFVEETEKIIIKQMGDFVKFNEEN